MNCLLRTLYLFQVERVSENNFLRVNISVKHKHAFPPILGEYFLNCIINRLILSGVFYFACKQPDFFFAVHKNVNKNNTIEIWQLSKAMLMHCDADQGKVGRC